MKAGQGGASLLEIVVAVTILSLLLGAGTPSVIYLVHTRQREEIDKEMSALAQATRLFAQQMGRAPRATPVSGLSAELSARGDLPAAAMSRGGTLLGWGGPYLRPAARVGDGFGTFGDPFTDPWGYPYEVRSLPDELGRPERWELRSVGRDGRSGTVDDQSLSEPFTGFLSVEVRGIDSTRPGQETLRPLRPTEVNVEVAYPVDGVMAPFPTPRYDGDAFVFDQPLPRGARAVRVIGRPSTPFAGRLADAVAQLDGKASRVTVFLEGGAALPPPTPTPAPTPAPTPVPGPNCSIVTYPSVLFTCIGADGLPYSDRYWIFERTVVPDLNSPPQYCGTWGMYSPSLVLCPDGTPGANQAYQEGLCYCDPSSFPP